MPPVGHPRRMWAGGEVTFRHPILIGAPLRQLSTIVDVQEKSDRMTFVKLRRDVYQDDWLVLTETQDIVYLPFPEVYSPPRAQALPPVSAFETDVEISQALLFRYSAATFNAHRIHYDLPYAQEVEKYPGLVVHGPLQATLLADAAIRHSGRRPATLKYRGVHPMFADEPMRLFGYNESQNGMSLCTGVPDSHQGMQATITWRA